MEILSKFVWPSTSKSFAIVTLPPDTLIPLLAVISPTASTLVTSSYVKTPPTFTSPVKLALTAVTIPVELILCVS